MADQIEGAAQEPEPEVVEAQPEGEVEAAQEAVVGEEQAVEEQPAGETAEAAPAEGEAEPAGEAPQEAAKPQIPKEVADAVANWNVWQTILNRNPELKAQAQAEYQRMANPQHEVQRVQQQPEFDEAGLKREWQQLREAGKDFEAQQLLVRHDPEVRRAREGVSQIERAEHERNLAEAKSEIAEHQKVFGSIEEDVRGEMTAMLAGGFKGNLVSTRVAALTKMGKLKEASALLTKAANAPQAQARSASVGGRIPAGKGAPAPRRVAKPGPTPGSGFTSEEVDWISKREAEQGGGVL